MNGTHSQAASGRSAPSGQALAERARPLFPVVGKVRYFDTATKAPLATPVRRALERFLESRHGEFVEKASWRPVVERARERFASRIGARPSEIGLVKNTSEGLNAIGHSIPWRPGDNLVVADTEHPNNLYPWLHLGRRYGVEVRLANSEEGVVTPECLEDRMDRDTRVVAVSAVSFLPGGRADLPAISRLCRKHEAHLVVDGIQSLGILRLDVAEAGIDALATGAHKGLLGPYGDGFLYCRQDLLSEWEPAYIARASVQANDQTYSFLQALDYQLLPTAARFELGNYNYEGVHALEAALEILDAFDPAEVEGHVLDLSGRLCEGLQDLGLQPLNPVNAPGRSGIVSFRPRNADHLRRELLRRQVVVAVKADALRVSFHLFNTREEVDSLLDDCREILEV